ncbi:protein-disulfide reductase DsbD family protein [Rhodobacteraceae bacterium D3-12]|nr:protein-disulfide reductase DsbD family protein [Rhodobacteraceae bacterium D3-12]
MRNRFSLALAALLTALPFAATAQSGGDPYSEMVQTRILPGWQMADGRHMAGIEIKLAQGWKTYWRAPGDAGIPPLFDWSGSANLRNVTVNWPTPGVFHQSGARSVGYKNTVVLPITITPRRDGKPVRLSGTIDLGVCRDVCVPVHVSLNEVLKSGASKPDPVIAAALADRPFSGKEAGLKASTCVVSPTKDGLAVTAEFTLPAAGGREVAVVETGDPMVWASEPDVARSGGRLALSFALVHASGGAFALNRSALRFTILGRNHAVDIQGCSG